MRKVASIAALVLAGCAPTTTTVTAATFHAAHHEVNVPEGTTTVARPTTTRASRGVVRTTTSEPNRTTTTANIGTALHVERAITPCGVWRTLIAQFFPANEVARACRIAGCESNWNPDARNRSGARGLFQLMHGPMPVEANVEAAAALWQTRGWRPWTCR